MKPDAIDVANCAFQRFTHGLETGEWDLFIGMLTEDFTFWFPTGAFHGLNHGKQRAREFFQYVAKSFPEGLDITVERVTSSETTVVFEFRDEGVLHGQLYKNRVAISLDVQGDKICSYREYFGSDGKSN